MPGEPFAEIGVLIRRGSPFAVTMVSGYSNGQFAYVPMRSDYANGGYGVWNSPIGPGGAETVVEEAARAAARADLAMIPLMVVRPVIRSRAVERRVDS